jgi:hypothetical protein
MNRSQLEHIIRAAGDIAEWCLDIHDLVIGKYVSGREKDLAFNRSVINQGLVSKENLIKRMDFLDLTDLLKNQIILKIKAEKTETEDSI